MSKQRIFLTSLILGLALAMGGCSTVQPTFNSAVNGMKSLFKKDESASGDDMGSASAGDSSSQADLAYQDALRYRAAGNEAEWANRLEDAAKLGHSTAAYELGMAYSQGEGVSKDLNTGARWINRSADLGDQRGQYLVGAIFLTGNGVRKDPGRGVTFLARAGEQGHVQAQYLLGVAYADGDGVAANPAWAARWYGRAARAGHTDGQYAYGVMFGSGLGLPKNDREAYRWLTLATSGGHKKAGDVAMEISKRLSSEQISQIEADAKRFVQKSYSTLNDPATVMFVQYALRNIGYDAGPIDGLPGKKTREGIRTYEEASNLPVKGQISVSLLNGLIESTSK